MKHIKTLFVALFAVMTTGASTQPLPGIIEQLRSEVDARRAMGYMRQIWETDHWFTFPKFQETAQM